MYLRQEKCAVQLGDAAAPHEQHEPHQCELSKPVYTTNASDILRATDTVADRLRTYISSASQYRYAGTYCDSQAMCQRKSLHHRQRADQTVYTYSVH